MWVSLPRACISSSSSSTSSSRRNWRRFSSCSSSSSCLSTHLETRLRTASFWTHLAHTQRARAPAAPTRPPGPPTTRSALAALPPRLAAAPPWSKTTEVKPIAILMLFCVLFEHLLRSPRSLRKIVKCHSQGFTVFSSNWHSGGLCRKASAPSLGISPSEAFWGPPWPSPCLSPQGLGVAANQR